MKNIFCLVLFFVWLFAGCIRQEKNKGETTNRFNWLNGLWVMKMDGGKITEQWKPVSDSLMEGSSDFVKGDSIIPFETIKIYRKDTLFFYEAKAAGQNNEQPVAFMLRSFSDSGFVAENPEHDFPKRIVYKLVTADSLHAYVDDGTETGKKQNFYYKRQ